MSVQIIEKVNGRYRVVKTVGCSGEAQQISALYHQARHEIQLMSQQSSLFVYEEDAQLESYLNLLTNAQIRVIGPELVYGRIYDKIGYGAIGKEIFRHLVISRLAYPGSKLKTVAYLDRYQGRHIEPDVIYRFMDTLYNKLKDRIETITFEHSKRVLGGKIGIVFYDVTTLYFEAADEDDLRRTGYSKDGKHTHPQILVGMLVGMNGYPIAYDIFEGNTFEGNTFIPVLENFEKRFALPKPTVVADAGLLSNKNIEALEKAKYKYILGARIKNESTAIKNSILALRLKNGKHSELRKGDTTRLIVHYSGKRAKKDEHTRKRGLKRPGEKS